MRADARSFQSGPPVSNPFLWKLTLGKVQMRFTNKSEERHEVRREPVLVPRLDQTGSTR